MKEWEGQIFNQYNTIERVAQNDGYDISQLLDDDVSDVIQYGNQAGFNLPLDSSKMGVKIKQDDQQDCPVSQRVSDCLVRLPLYFDLSTEEQNKIIQTVLSFKI